MTEIATMITPRLAAVFEAGNPDDLHPILSTWSQEELLELELDMREAYRAGVAYLDAEYALILRHRGFLPECEAIWRAKRRGLLEVFMEIYEVVYQYKGYELWQPKEDE